MKTFLTGKCKDEFDNWLSKNTNSNTSIYDELEFRMIFGIVEDFFDTVGYDISTSASDYTVWSNHLIAFRGTKVIEGVVLENEYETNNRDFVRKTVLKELNKFYNERHNDLSVTNNQ